MYYCPNLKCVQDVATCGRDTNYRPFHVVYLAASLTIKNEDGRIRATSIITATIIKRFNLLGYNTLQPEKKKIDRRFGVTCHVYMFYIGFVPSIVSNRP
jgi:hypothetical protein